MQRDSWNEIVVKQGTTRRERTKNKAINDFDKLSKDSLSYKNVLINGESKYITIYSGTMENKKNICSKCGESFNIGDMVKYCDSNWIILRANVDDEIYTKGYMERCNYKLKWQDEDGNIIEQECLIASASQYNSGEFAVKTITIGYNQLMISIQMNDDTIKIKSDDRFFIDNNTDNPKPYRVTRVDTVSLAFDGVGCISLIVTEDQYNPTTDSIEKGICDYYEPSSTTSDIVISYAGMPQIICGGTAKTFTADRDVTFSIDVSSGIDNITFNQTGTNKCKLKCSKVFSMIGSTIKLKYTDGTDSGNMYIDIVSSV